MKKKLYTLVMIVALAVFIGSGYYLASYYLEAKIAESNIDDLIQIKEKEQQAGDMSKANVLSGYQQLHTMNDDFVGWIKVPGSKIDYPIMQTKSDEEYYIHRDFEKKEAKSGLPFLAAVCDMKNQTHNLVVYGHHMKSGDMFAGLLDYKDKSFYETHKTIELDSLTEPGKYQVFAGFYTKIFNKGEKAFRFYNYPGKLSKKEFAEYVKQVKELSEYDTGVVPKYKEQLVTLVTCSYHTENGRFVVVARKVN